MVRVDGYEPRNAAASPSPVRVHFSQPFVPLTWIQSLVTDGRVKILPAVKGQWIWKDARTLEFQAFEDFQSATNYQVIVKAGYESLVGTALVEDVSFSFLGASVLKPDATRLSQWQQWKSAANESVMETEVVPGLRVEWYLPRRVLSGDEYEVRAVLHNLSDDALEFALSWGALHSQMLQPMTTPVVLEAKSATTVRQKFKADTGVNTRQGKVFLFLHGVNDDVTTNAAVVVTGTRRWQKKEARGTLTTEAVVVFDKPMQADQGVGKLSLDLSLGETQEMHSDDDDRNAVVRVVLNHHDVMMSRLNAMRPLDGIDLPFDKLPQHMEIRLVKESGVEVAYQLVLHSAITKPRRERIETDVSVRRTIYDEAGREVSATSLSAGHVYEVRHIIFSSDVKQNLVLKDALFGAVNCLPLLNVDYSCDALRGVTMKLPSLKVGWTEVSFWVRSLAGGSFFWSPAEVVDQERHIVATTNSVVMAVRPPTFQ